LGAKLHLLAATEAGVVTAFLTNPIWVIKTRMQLQRVNAVGNYKGMRDAVLTIAREEGFIGFYKGFVPALFGVSHGALQFMAYEELKHLLQKYYGHNQLNSFHYLCIGGTSKIFATVATYPYQVIKSRLQERPIDNKAKYNGVWDVCTKIWRNEGARGFYKGLVPNVLRVTPAAAITFLSYETIMKMLNPL